MIWPCHGCGSGSCSLAGEPPSWISQKMIIVTPGGTGPPPNPQPRILSTRCPPPPDTATSLPSTCAGLSARCRGAGGLGGLGGFRVGAGIMRNAFHLLFFFFFRPHPRHMGVPRPGVQSERQLPAYTTAAATQDPSHICNLHHSSWQRQILNPLSRAWDQTCVLMDASRVYYQCTTGELPPFIFNRNKY